MDALVKSYVKRFARANARCGWLLGLIAATSIPAQAQINTGELQVSDGGVPVSRVVSDPGVPYENVFRNQRILSQGLRPKVGDGGTLQFGMPGGMFSSGASLPFIERGFSPNDATIKLGRFYLDVGPLSGSILWSDNVNRNNANRESGIISVARLEFRSLIQWTEGLQFAVRGAFIWLPFQNEAGLDGFGIFDPVNARFSAAGGRIPLRAQFSYDFLLGKWDMQFIDDFQADFTDGFFGLRGEFADELVITDPLTFNEQDRAGFYRYGGVGQNQTSRRAGRTTQLDTNQQLDTRSLVIRNLIGLSATRVVPTNTRMRLYGSHEDLWYVSDDPGNARTIDTAGVMAVNQRENMRFKPFADYRVSKISTRSGVNQQAQGGLFGPITDQVDFLGSAGWQKAWGSNQDNLIWQLNVIHEAGPFTTQTVTYSRQQSSGTGSNNDIIQALTYGLWQTLGPNMRGGIFARWLKFEDNDNRVLDTTQWVVGARLLYQYSPKTDLFAQVVRTQIYEKDPAVGDSVFLVAQAGVSHRYSESITGRILYRHDQRQRDTLVAGRSYSENVVVFTIEKQFQ